MNLLKMFGRGEEKKEHGKDDGEEGKDDGEEEKVNS
jgi:hypothetical protein